MFLWKIKKKNRPISYLEHSTNPGLCCLIKELFQRTSGFIVLAYKFIGRKYLVWINCVWNHSLRMFHCTSYIITLLHSEWLF